MNLQSEVRSKQAYPLNTVSTHIFIKQKRICSFYEFSQSSISEQSTTQNLRDLLWALHAKPNAVLKSSESLSGNHFDLELNEDFRTVSNNDALIFYFRFNSEFWCLLSLGLRGFFLSERGDILGFFLPNHYLRYYFYALETITWYFYQISYVDIFSISQASKQMKKY